MLRLGPGQLGEHRHEGAHQLLPNQDVGDAESLAPFAQLIVAGSRGQGGIAGMLLGSTGQALIAHGTCPVVIVRPALVAALS